MKKVAIQGTLGSYHDIAAHKYFEGEEIELICCANFEDVFGAIKKDSQTIGMLAIENTIAGSLLHADAFSALMDTLRLPKEEAGRAEKVQAAFMRAAEVPLALGQAVFPLLGMARTVVADGNAWAITDGVIAAMNARSAMRAAFYSVRVNLQSVEDAAYVYRTLAVMADYEDRADYEERLIESIYKKRR